MTLPRLQPTTAPHKPVLGVALSCLALGLGQSALAQEADGAGWSYVVAPYLWGAGLSGQAGTLPSVPPADFDLSFGDILDSLEGAAMIVGQARNGRWAISADLQHVTTTSTGSNPDAGITRAELDSTTQSLSVHLDYQLYQDDRAQVWVSGGARYWNVETDLRLSDGVNPEVFGRGSDSWWDPVIGLRGSMALGSDFHVRGWAYLGGFGAGSDLMTDVFAGVGYRVADWATLVGGVRYQSVDRQSGSFLWDVEQYGPLVGLSFTF
jgi:hypothetical protein